MAATVSGESDRPSLISPVSRSAGARSLRIEVTSAAFCSSARFGANSASSASAGTPASTESSNIPPSTYFMGPLQPSSRRGQRPARPAVPRIVEFPIRSPVEPTVARRAPDGKLRDPGEHGSPISLKAKPLRGDDGKACCASIHTGGLERSEPGHCCSGGLSTEALFVNSQTPLHEVPQPGFLRLQSRVGCPHGFGFECGLAADLFVLEQPSCHGRPIPQRTVG